jgi:carbonic anhydrase
MTTSLQVPLPAGVAGDFKAGLVVFLVALPLSLGVALASNAPPLAGLVAGIVGGIVVGLLSGSHTSVSGSSPGLAAVVAAQIAALGSFEAFLLALTLAGIIQIALGYTRCGFIAAFFPSSVIKGLLAAIGILLILKQVPHIVGYDPDPEGEMAFEQRDTQNTFSELIETVLHIEPRAAFIGAVSLALLALWEWWPRLKRSPVPAPLVVVLLGVILARLVGDYGDPWAGDPQHFVAIPVTTSLRNFLDLFVGADFSQLRNPAIFSGAITLAAVASLETLLNLEAVDKIDPQQRTSPPSRELIAQGVGNVACGLLGGLPVSSAIVRSSVNVQSGAGTRWATVIHGAFLLGSVALFARWLNMVPLASLAAILLVTGVKLASPALVQRMWSGGRSQFVPFAITVFAIIFTDLLVGVLIGLGSAAMFILWSNARRPIRRVLEKHLGGDVLHVELANQVSFLNRAALAKVLDDVPSGGHVLLDGRGTDYIDPDVLDLIRDFTDRTGPARGVTVSLVGFRSRYQLEDQTQYVDYSTRELQEAITPEQVLQILKDGHERFQSGHRLTRDLGRQVEATAAGQHPLAVVLSCIDSRTPAELIFDLGVGDVFSVRVAGNITSRKILGSIEYGCAVAGAKLVLVMGHTRCGAVGAAVNFVCTDTNAAAATGCLHLDHVLAAIQQSIEPGTCPRIENVTPDEKQSVIDTIARLNVRRAVRELLGQSETLGGLVRQGKILVVGAMYDVATGGIEFLQDSVIAPPTSGTAK